MTTTMELADQLLLMKRYPNVRLATEDAATLQEAADRLMELERKLSEAALTRMTEISQELGLP